MDDSSRAPLLVLTTPVDTFVCDSINHARGIYRIASIGKQCVINTQKQDEEIGKYEQAIKQKDQAMVAATHELAIKETMIINRDSLIVMKDRVISKAIGVISVQKKEIRTSKAFAWGGVGLAVLVAMVSAFAK